MQNIIFFSSSGLLVECTKLTRRVALYSYIFEPVRAYTRRVAYMTRRVIHFYTERTADLMLLSVPLDHLFLHIDS